MAAKHIRHEIREVREGVDFISPVHVPNRLIWLHVWITKMWINSIVAMDKVSFLREYVFWFYPDIELLINSNYPDKLKIIPTNAKLSWKYLHFSIKSHLDRAVFRNYFFCSVVRIQDFQWNKLYVSSKLYIGVETNHIC